MHTFHTKGKLGAEVTRSHNALRATDIAHAQLMDVDPDVRVVIDVLVNTSAVPGAMVIGGSIPF